MTVERLADRDGVEFRKERFWNAERARCRIRGHEVTLLKPLSYVNLSGPVVRKVSKDLEVERRDVLVVLDDFWLPLGRLRIRKQGGGGGHNGLDSVVRAFQSKDVARLRIGIGVPQYGEAVDHVLSRFRTEERPIVTEAIERAADAVMVWASDGLDAAMNRFNPTPDESGEERSTPEGR